jgi:hypothetical protein
MTSTSSSDAGSWRGGLAATGSHFHNRDARGMTSGALTRQEMQAITPLTGFNLQRL